MPERWIPMTRWEEETTGTTEHEKMNSYAAWHMNEDYPYFRGQGAGANLMAVKHVYLIAEDEEASRILLKRAFLKSGLDVPVHFTVDGQETIDYLRGRGKFKDRSEFPFPAILLLDYQMPKLNGFDVLKEIRADAALKKLAVVMLSSSISESQIQRAYELGVNSYIEKPANFGELVHSISCINQYWFGCNHFPHTVNGIVHPEKRHAAAGR